MGFSQQALFNIKCNIPIFLYGLINFLFIWKYGSRQDQLPFTLGLFAFTASIILFIKYYNRINVFWLASIVGLALSIGINVLVDCESLTVDRCSALSVSINDIFNGNYPYDAIDHMGGRSSHLPGLFVIAMPFYLIGDVGILQVGALLLFIYALKINIRHTLLPLGLLLLSPAYWYEIYVKSDLLSNFLIICSVYLLFKKYHNNLNPIWIGISLSILLLTRFTSIIPIAVLFIPYILKSQTLRIVLAGIVGSILLITMVQPWSVDASILWSQNPLELQSRFVPMWLSISIVAVAVYIGWQRKLSDSPYTSIVFLLLIPILFSLAFNIAGGSFYNSIINSSFDISYFNMTLPFLIMWIAEICSPDSITD